MRRAMRGVLSVVWVTALLGCGKGAAVDKIFKGDTQWVLAAPERFELMTIDPSHDGDFDSHAPGTMHGYRILGTAVVTDGAEIKGLVEGLYAGARDVNASHAQCFNPRHAIRATRGGKTVDVLVCFSCGEIEVYGDVAGRGITGREAEAVFAAAVGKAGLAVAP